MSETRIRVLSLNCWGLKFVSKNRKERIEAIAHEIKASNYDIVTLQEIWVFADYEHVQERVSKRLAYSKYFYSGALGSGLAIFSRFPIISTEVHPYSLNGAPMDVVAGDWFVGKAAASVVVLHPVLGQVQIFNTHLFAKGGEDGPEYNRAHRLVNAWEFAKLTRHAAELGRYVIAAGDFNTIPTGLPMEIIRQHAALSDSWVVAHSQGSLTSPASSPLDAVVRLGVTADSPLNTWSAGKQLDPTARQFSGKRLDYILYRQPRRPLVSKDQRFPVIRCSECQVVMTSKVPEYNCSFSDHFGLEATLEIEECYQILDGTSPSGVASLPEPSNPTDQFSESELSDTSIATAVQALTACYRFSRQRARRELTIFGLGFLLLIAIIVGSAWHPLSWANPILLSFTVFVSWLATTMLYEGFLYGNWERNALMNVIEELEIHSKGLELKSGNAMLSGSFRPT